MVIKYLDEFIKQYADSLPPKIHYFKSEFEDELYRALTLALQKLNLVTRHEFDIQAQVLANTRDQLEKLTQQISRLEKQ